MCPLSYRLPLALGYYTGMREGEILGLRWEQVKFLENVVELNAGETKNDEGRTVPIIPSSAGCSWIATRSETPPARTSAISSIVVAPPFEFADSARRGILHAADRGSER
jgi:Phage integrase family